MVDQNQQARAVDCPEPCFVRMQLARGGVFIAARIFHRLGVLVAEINGSPADPMQVWHGGDLINQERYDLMMRYPELNPYRRIHLSDAGLADAVRQQDEADYWATQPIR